MGDGKQFDNLNPATTRGCVPLLDAYAAVFTMSFFHCFPISIHRHIKLIEAYNKANEIFEIQWDWLLFVQRSLLKPV